MRDYCAALTIAGSDSGGGAGIQADIKTFTAFGIFGTSVITAITAQNLEGVYAIQSVECSVINKQLTAVLDGFPIKAIKTGMLFSADIIREISEVLNRPKYRNIPLIVDPVMISTSGKALLEEKAVSSLMTELFPRAALITPNIPEAEVLLNERIGDFEHMKEGAERLMNKFGIPTLLKGGHMPGGSVDVLADSEGIITFESELIRNVNTHGTGCTLASAITAGIAKGEPLRTSILHGKHYLTRTLRNAVKFSPTLSVMNHLPPENK